jgi:cyclopropane fatty-acyl-phospholipid synthase-like methyltransferase
MGVQSALGSLDGWPQFWEELGQPRPSFRFEAAEHIRRLAAALPLEPTQRVLDFGCGFGHAAAELAPRVGEVFLWDAAANMRRYARIHTAGYQNVNLLDLSDPDRLPPDLRFDLIVVNSVVQYMGSQLFRVWLSCWRRMLARSGRLVLSDLITTEHRAGRELLGLLWRRPLLVFERVGCGIGRYWKTRSSLPLWRISRDELCALASREGLRVEFLDANLTHLTSRVAAVLTASEETGDQSSCSPDPARV